MTQYFSYLKQLAMAISVHRLNIKIIRSTTWLHQFSRFCQTGSRSIFPCGNTGVSAGVIAALKQNTKWDYTVWGWQ